MGMNVAAECMRSRCDQWARPATLLPAEPFVEDVAEAKSPIGSGLAGGELAFKAIQSWQNDFAHFVSLLLDEKTTVRCNDLATLQVVPDNRMTIIVVNNCDNAAGIILESI